MRLSSIQEIFLEVISEYSHSVKLSQISFLCSVENQKHFSFPKVPENIRVSKDDCLIASILIKIVGL